MAKEVKIGILMLITFAVMFWGYKFVLGSNILVKSNIYYVEYDNVLGIDIGTEVRRSGVKIGAVSDIQLMHEKNERVLVALDLDKDFKVPKDAVAALMLTGMMGGKAIEMEYSKTCSGDDCAQSGDYIKGETRNMLSSLASEQTIENYMNLFNQKLGELADSINYILLSEDSNTSLAKMVQDAAATMENLKGGTAQLNAILANSRDDINTSMSSLNSLLAELESKKGALGHVMENADSITSQLAQTDLGKTMEEVQASIVALKATLQKADTSLGSLSQVMDKVNQGEGSLGKLVKDEELYNNLNDMTKNINQLSKDLKEKPYRYLPLKSKRKVDKYDAKDANQ